MHANELRAYTIDAEGIQLGGMLVDQEGLLGGRPTRKRSLVCQPPDDEPRDA
jgi:circadian clock protein KaiC